MLEDSLRSLECLYTRERGSPRCRRSESLFQDQYTPAVFFFYCCETQLVLVLLSCIFHCCLVPPGSSFRRHHSTQQPGLSLYLYLSFFTSLNENAASRLYCTLQDGQVDSLFIHPILLTDRWERVLARPYSAYLLMLNGTRYIQGIMGIFVTAQTFFFPSMTTTSR